MTTAPKKRITEKIAFEVLRRLVKERYYDVLTHPAKLETDRWNLSDFFYSPRKELEDAGYDTAPLNDSKTGWRKKIYAKVRVICETELGIKRHEAGIFPADRAVMAFQGELYNISFDNVKLLKDYGPDLIFIEKEGLVEKLVPFTTHLGIALVHSQGFYSEYAQMLAAEAAKWGANVGILTDFDASGINMGLEIKEATRLGIDLETVQYLGLNIEELQESSLTKKGKPSSHWVGLNNTLNGKKKRKREKEWTDRQREFYFSYLLKEHDGYRYIDFLKTKRIELDTVVNAVGAERFWEWLKEKILDTFETRDYNRAIAIPSYLPTPTMQEFQRKLEEITEVITEGRRYEIAGKLRTLKEFPNTDHKLEEIKTHLLNHVVLKSAKIKRIDLGLKKLLKTLG